MNIIPANDLKTKGIKASSNLSPRGHCSEPHALDLIRHIIGY